MNGRPLEVADLGANVGLFTAWLMGRRRDARVVAFEPDPANAAVLREFLRANGRQDDVEVVQACAATEEGQVSFAGGGFGGSHVLAAGEQADAVMSVPATDAFPYITRADLLKIDIEGGEWAILADSRFANVAAQALVLEYHAHLCPEPDPRACADRLLADAGWTVQHVDVELPPGHGLLWAWK
jgi:FkbM family methyltransferase